MRNDMVCIVHSIIMQLIIVKADLYIKSSN